MLSSNSAQMRGRGSRICPRIGKTDFWIYDFVGNAARFNDLALDYHSPKEIGLSFSDKQGTNVVEGKGSGWVLIPEGSKEDELRNQHFILVGPDGLAMDRDEYQESWSATVSELRKTNPAVQKIFSGSAISENEWESLRRQLDAPTHYFSEQNLRKAFEQPTGSLTDFIRAAYGAFIFPTWEERIERVFNTWVTEHSSSLKPEQARMLRLLKQRVLAGDSIEPRIFSQPPFSIYGGRARMEQLFGKNGLSQVIEELNLLLAA